MCIVRCQLYIQFDFYDDFGLIKKYIGINGLKCLFFVIYNLKNMNLNVFKNYYLKKNNFLWICINYVNNIL